MSYILSKYRMYVYDYLHNGQQYMCVLINAEHAILYSSYSHTAAISLVGVTCSALYGVFV